MTDSKVGIFNATSWLYFYFLFFIPVEICNGIFLYHGFGLGSNLITLVKLVMVLVGMLFVMQTSKDLSRYLFLAILLFCIIIMFQGLLGSFQIRTLFIFSKLLFNAVAIYYYYYCITVNRDYRKIYNIVLFNSIVLILNIFLSYFGIGFDNYTSGDGEGFGGTGYLYAGNEVGAALLASLASLLILLRINLKSILVITCYLIAGFLVASKASLLGVVLALSFLIYYHSRGIFLLIFCAFFMLSPILWNIFSSKFELAINRWLFLIDEFGIEYFLLGGAKRVDYIVGTVFVNFQNNPLQIVFGSGWTGEPENNLFDLFEGFGLSGVALFLLWGLLILKGGSVLVTRSSTPEVRSAYVIGVMILVLSLMAGHVLQSSLMAPFMFFLWIGLKGKKLNEL